MRLVGRLSAGCSSNTLGSQVGGIWLDPIKKNAVALSLLTAMKNYTSDTMKKTLYINCTIPINPSTCSLFYSCRPCLFHSTLLLWYDKLLMLIVCTWLCRLYSSLQDKSAVVGPGCLLPACQRQAEMSLWPVLSAVNPACSALSKLLFEQWSCLLVC